MIVFAMLYPVLRCEAQICMALESVADPHCRFLTNVRAPDYQQERTTILDKIVTLVFVKASAIGSEKGEEERGGRRNAFSIKKTLIIFTPRSEKERHERVEECKRKGGRGGLIQANE